MFAYAADPRNLAEWNSAVRAVTPATEPGRDARYVMERRLPGGDAVNGLEIIARDPPHGWTIRTTYGPTPFSYRYELAAASSTATILRLGGEVRLPRLVAAVDAVAGRLVKQGVDANLDALRRILER